MRPVHSRSRRTDAEAKTVPNSAAAALNNSRRAGSVVAVAFGGSPSADELQRKVRETFPNVRTTTNAYGLT